MENKEKSKFARSPNLETIKMIESFIHKNSGKFSRRELWENLPRKVMWQTFLVAFEYLLESNKIATKNKNIIWINGIDLIKDNNKIKEKNEEVIKIKEEIILTRSYIG